jgi:phage terminase large subunit-like protein
MPSTSSALAGPPVRPPSPTWAPKWHTARRWPHTDGPDHADFAESLLKVTKGRRAGAPLSFRPWQRWLLDGLLERRPDGRLRYRRALIGLARKNGKSLLGTEMALFALYNSDGESVEVYSAAGDRQQARIVFGEARHQVLNSPILNGKCRVFRDVIEVPSTGSIYRVLSADAKLQQGLNPSLVLFDELHVQPNDDLWDA